MANRKNHYEAALEAFLREREVPYVAVDESRRALMSGGSLKSLDFIVSSPEGGHWLIDVKGRRFPSGNEQKHYWKNWSSRDDLRSLARWEQLFGGDFASVLVFAYHLVGNQSPLPADQLFAYRNRLYGFVAIGLHDYAPYARPISESWDTVAMPVGRFRAAARPIEDLLAPVIPESSQR